MCDSIPKNDDLPDQNMQTFALVTALLPGKRPIVRLSRTIFLPDEDEQTANRGWIGSARVLHVARRESEIDHYVDTAEALSVGERYSIAIDAYWRHVIASVRDAAGKIYHDAIQAGATNIQVKLPRD